MSKQRLLYTLMIFSFCFFVFSCREPANINMNYVLALQYDDMLIKEKNVLDSLKITMIERQIAKYDINIHKRGYHNSSSNYSGQYMIEIYAKETGTRVQRKFNRAMSQLLDDQYLMGARIEDPSGTYKIVEIYPFAKYACFTCKGTKVIKINLEKQ